MTTCTFAGHREVYQADVGKALDAAISSILGNGDDSYTFLVGGMGDFDGLCAGAVRAAKRRHPDKQITLALVEPYMKQEINTGKDYYEMIFDDVIIPIELADVHYKAAITKRNRWMVDASQVLIAFVYRDHGGAYTTLRYAQKKNLQIINLANNPV